MEYSLQIQKLLIKVDAESSLTGKANLIKQAITIADSHNDIEWGYDLRISLMDTCDGVMKNTEALPAFVWLLDACDRNPDLFDEKELLWKYKWMIDSAARSSKTSMEQLNAIIDDYKNRLLRNGYSLRSYYGILISIGFITENIEMVARNLELREQHERDDMSDTEPHDLYDRILYYFMKYDVESALMLEVEMYKKNKENISNTFAISTCYAEFLTRTNRLETAQRFIELAEKTFTDIVYKDRYLMVTLSSLIYALTITNPKAAWDYFEQYAHWFDEGEEYDTMIFGLNILPLLTHKGEVKLQLNSRLSIYNPTGTYDTQNLFDYFYTATKTLAELFDQRNQSNAFIKYIAVIDEQKSKAL